MTADKPGTYKIGQAAKLLGVKPFVLRFWEGEFPELAPIRTPSGQRLYTDEHLELVRRIQKLLREDGLTIEGARRRLREDAESAILREIGKELREIRDLLGGAPGTPPGA